MAVYRRDIDGLRAIAVTSVVLFHAELALRGGFVGVDVFFVISGYLITCLIVEEIRVDNFTISKFYERRVRRIFPALVAVLLFSSLAAFFIEMPGPFDDFCKSLVATTAFLSNVIFWRQTGYFDGPALEKPLLHMWSLAVEEQFYIIFPISLIIIARRGGGKYLWWLVITALASFFACLYATYFYRTSAFFLAPMRAWELLLGSIVAVAKFPTISHKNASEVISVIGLSLIVFAAAGFSEATAFPGAAAALPAGGAALLIYSGSDGRTRISRFLASGPLVTIGLMSYSLYLWHWPLLVFAQTFAVDDVSVAKKILIVGISFVVAALSWKYVELPFRTPRKVARGPLMGAAAFAMSAFIVFGLFGHWSGGWPTRLPTQAQKIASYITSVNPRQSECLAAPDLSIPAEAACVYGGSAKASYALWGDSNADTLIEMLGSEAEKSGSSIKFLGYRGCPPLVEAGRIGEYTSCLPHNNEVMAYLIAHTEIHTVILCARWSFYISGYGRELGPGERKWEGDEFITDRDGRNLSAVERQKFFSERVRATVDQLLAAHRRVVLVYPIPETGFDIPLTLGQLTIAGRDPSTFTRPAESFYQRQKFVLSVFDSLGTLDNLIRIRPSRRLCDERECIVFADDKPLYRDSDHLSLPGAEYISPLFSQIFERNALNQAAIPPGAVQH